MNIGVVLNRPYIKYLYVCLVSVLESNPDETVNIYVTYEDIEDSELEVFSLLEEKYGCKMFFFCLDSIVFPEFLPVSEHWPMTIYYHLLFGDLLSEDVDRILYLDTDVIVHNSLRPLYEMDFEDNYIIACKDMTLPNGFDDLTEMQKPLFAADKENFLYFNTGTMLLNLKKIREEFSFAKWMELAEKYLPYLFAPDQDLVNIAFYGKVKYVDEYKYNMFGKLAHNQGLTLDWVRANNTIIHYGGRKPWIHEAYRYSLERLWWEYAKLTPFYTDLLETLVLAEIDSGFVEQMVVKLDQDNKELLSLVDKMKQFIPGL